MVSEAGFNSLKREVEELERLIPNLADTSGRRVFQFCRLTAAEIAAITSPVEGMVVRNTTTGDTEEYKSGNWQAIGSGGGGGSWTVPTLVNGWVNYGGGFSPVGYCKGGPGFVHLRGLIANGTAGTIFTLPPGFRPTYRQLLATISSSALARVDIYADGTVISLIYNSAWLSLDGLTFATF